ncbi:MAG: hypothetical protein QOD10_308 [Mycobacterium sp.]|jgi:hypothetical protein|nr:hypothetical protein [Mycobacterium sp.]
MVLLTQLIGIPFFVALALKLPQLPGDLDDSLMAQR